MEREAVVFGDEPSHGDGSGEREQSGVGAVALLEQEEEAAFGESAGVAEGDGPDRAALGHPVGGGSYGGRSRV